MKKNKFAEDDDQGQDTPKLGRERNNIDINNFDDYNDEYDGGQNERDREKMSEGDDFDDYEDEIDSPERICKYNEQKKK